MSLRQKTPGDFGGTRGVQGAASRATRMYANLTPSRASSSKADNRVTDTNKLGSSRGTQSISSSNDINKFTSGISMHHPYKDRGGAFDTTKNQYQANPASISRLATPSGRGTADKSGGQRTMRQVRSPKPYDDIMRENGMPADGGADVKRPSGAKGGTQAVMNRMKAASVNKMGRR